MRRGASDPARIWAFARYLRAAGLRVGLSEVIDCLRATTICTSPADLYPCLKCTLVKDPMDFPVFDRLFGLYFKEETHRGAGRPGAGGTDRQGAVWSADANGVGKSGVGRGFPAPVQAVARVNREMLSRLAAGAVGKWANFLALRYSSGVSKRSLSGSAGTGRGPHSVPWTTGKGGKAPGSSWTG